MLVPAAVDAIRQARYRPWTLNGEPVEVETTVNVVFSLGNN
jgi:protein TonB